MRVVFFIFFEDGLICEKEGGIQNPLLSPSPEPHLVLQFKFTATSNFTPFFS
jgi:hypothetical protein